MSTIREVAQKAGVSFTTVSHVINNTRFVSPDTRARVLAAMEELHYRPNALAQSLRSGRTHTLGLVLPDSSNPFFAEVGRSIENAAFNLDYSVILCNTEGDPHKEQLYLEVLSKKQVDGIIFVATGDRGDSLRILLGHEMPVVVMDRDLTDISVDAVLVDNRQGGYLATRHLIELGHARIGCIALPSTLTPSAERVVGYRTALLEAGLPFSEELVTRGDTHPQSGQDAAARLLELADPPSAIFVGNDLMAVGVMRQAALLGLHLPEDLAIVGFDDIELASYLSPALTTIAQPKAVMGMRGVQLLFERIADPARHPHKEILPTRLVLRESSYKNVKVSGLQTGLAGAEPINPAKAQSGFVPAAE